MPGRCLPPLCCGCCTHRLFDPAVVWSDNVRERCGDGTTTRPGPAVIAAAFASDVYYLLVDAPRQLPDTTWEHDYVAQAWSAAGAKLWESAVLATTAGLTGLGRIASDGTSVWAIVWNDGDTIFRLDASDGSTLYSGAMPGGTTYDVAAKGDGTAYVAHEFTSDGDGDGYVSVFDDGSIVDRFGGTATDAGRCGSTSTAYSLAVDGSTLYVGSSPWLTSDFADAGDENCCTSGRVARFDSGVLKWLSFPGAGQDGGIHDSDRILVSHANGTVFAANVGYAASLETELWALEDEWGVPQWGQSLDMVAGDCGGVAAITDLDADDSYVWVTACRWLYQLNHAGAIQAAVPHATDAEGDSNTLMQPLLAVAADGAGNAMAGGRAVKCDVYESESRTKTDWTCGAWSQDCRDTPPDYCHTNECGSVSTNGRIALDVCTPDQWPPCLGSGYISWNCGSGVETRTFEFSAACDTGTGDFAWGGSFTGGSVTVTWVCGVGPTVDVVIDGCDVTMTSTTFTCDGPLGYAAVYYRFTLDCESCSGDGCGAMNDDACSDPNAWCCDPSPRPETLTGTVGIDNCEALNGKTVTFDWYPAVGRFEGAVTDDDGKVWGFAFTCGNNDAVCDDWMLTKPTEVGAVDCWIEYTTASLCSCDPVEVTFGSSETSGGAACCDSSIAFSLVITE